MDELQFYPTPKALADRAWAMFKNRAFVRILEPSAGDGDLADAHPWERDRYYHRSSHPVIDCCEVDVIRHATLRSKGYNVVGLDFLRFGNAAIYSHILLNPPFANGAEHVLKAWESSWDTEIVAIINADTLRNPFSRDRQMLVNLIEQHGEAEIIEGAFSVPDADRKTDVDIALVYLKKKADIGHDIVGDLIGDLERDAETGVGLAGDYREPQAVALPNSLIENSVITFNAAVRAMRETVRYEARARHYAALIGETMAVRNGEGSSSKEDSTADWVKSEVASRYDTLKDRAWASMLRSANVAERLSSAAQKRVESEFEGIKKLEYTKANVYGFLCGLVGSQGKIQNDMICDCFDLIGKYHSENVVYALGWKSNSRHRTCAMRIKTTRFILPGHGNNGWNNGLSWDSEKLLADFDKCFALLDGKAQPEASLVQVFRENFRGLCDGGRFSSSYFDCRYYPGIGTIHFFPRRHDLIDRLNRVVGMQRQWLPEAGTSTPEGFWEQWERAEQFDKEVRKEVAKKKRSWWDNPFSNLNNDERKTSAMNEIGEAICTVLERHGIKTDNLLEDRSEHQDQLLLLAA